MICFIFSTKIRDRLHLEFYTTYSFALTHRLILDRQRIDILNVLFRYDKKVKLAGRMDITKRDKFLQIKILSKNHQILKKSILTHLILIEKLGLRLICNNITKDATHAPSIVPIAQINRW